MAAAAVGSRASALELRDGAVRRQIFPELKEIRDAIISSKLTDKMTLSILKWCDRFEEEFKTTRHPQFIKEKYIESLKKLLVDPITGVPFDDDAVLGLSDGQAYSKKSLDIFLSALESEERLHSPFDQAKKKAPLSTIPHSVISCAVKWLKKHGAYQPDASLERTYRLLSEQNSLAGVPTEQTERARRIRERNRETRERQERDHQQRMQNFYNTRYTEADRAASREIRQTLGPIQDIARQRLQVPAETLDTQLEMFSNTLRSLNNSLDELEFELREIETSLRDANVALSEQERETLQLRQSIIQIDRESLQNRQASIGVLLGRSENHRAPDMLREDSLRRCLRAEMDAIGRAINDSHCNDELTLKIKDWQVKFLRKLSSNVDPEIVKTEYIDLLMEILRDPLRNNPIEEALLGSDGITYSKKSLILHLTIVPEAFRYRSPYNPENPALFTTIPHPVVPQIADWLKNYGRVLKSREFDGIYEAGMAGRAMPQIPTETNQRARLRREAQAAREQAQAQVRAENISRREQSAEAAADEQRGQAFGRVESQLNSMGQGVTTRLNDFEQQSNADFVRISEEIDRQDDEIDQLEEENKNLEDTLTDANNGLSQMDKELAHLKIEVNEIKIALKKRKKERLKKLLKTAAIVGACVLASWAAWKLLPELIITFTPAKGGALAGAALPF